MSKKWRKIKIEEFFICTRVQKMIKKWRKSKVAEFLVKKKDLQIVLFLVERATVSREVLLEIWPKFYKWYQKLPSYVCIITQKYYQSEACTLRELAIFVSRVGRVDSRNFHLSSTVIPTFYEFLAPKPPCRGYDPTLMHIFGLSILLENFWYQSEPRRILGRVILARKFKPLFCPFPPFT